ELPPRSSPLSLHDALPISKMHGAAPLNPVFWMTDVLRMFFPVVSGCCFVFVCADLSSFCRGMIFCVWTACCPCPDPPGQQPAALMCRIHRQARQCQHPALFRQMPAGLKQVSPPEPV